MLFFSGLDILLVMLARWGVFGDHTKFSLSKSIVLERVSQYVAVAVLIGWTCLALALFFVCRLEPLDAACAFRCYYASHL
jgi:hypothetical protein